MKAKEKLVAGLLALTIVASVLFALVYATSAQTQLLRCVTCYRTGVARRSARRVGARSHAAAGDDRRARLAALRRGTQRGP